MKTVEYKVRPVTRYVVTRFEKDDVSNYGSIDTIGEFPNEAMANRVKAGLEKFDQNAESLPPNQPPSN